MTTPVIETPHPQERGDYTPSVGSLLGAELLRVRSRRFVRWASLGLLGVLVLVATITFFQSAKPTDAQIDRAVATCSQPTEYDEFGNPVPAEPPSPEQGTELSPAPSPATGDPELGPACGVRDAVGAFDKRPNLTSDIPEEMIGVGLGVAVLAFVLGCTLGGADWSQKTMAALLFWEPRRARLFLVKLAAVLISLSVLLVVAQLVWLVMKSVLIQVHGVGDVSYGSINQDAWTALGRSFVLVLAMGALAYGIASLARNTGAALGAGFVYFAIIEMFINGLLPRFAQWTLTINIGALLTEGGLDEQIGDKMLQVSSLHGAVVLIAYAAGICLIGLELFRRRDVT